MGRPTPPADEASGVMYAVRLLGEGSRGTGVRSSSPRRNDYIPKLYFEQVAAAIERSVAPARACHRNSPLNSPRRGGAVPVSSRVFRQVVRQGWC